MNQRDLELLSSYLDGQLTPSDSARVENRLKTDPQWASVFNDLRATRTLLRRLPARKAPRNFTLTRKMVGQNPPLPRSYPLFRFTTALATLLLVFSFGLNSASRMAAPVGGYGGGGGDPASVQESAELYSADAAATEAPAAAAPAEEPSVQMVPLPTMTADPAAANETGRAVEETPTLKNAEDLGATGVSQAPVPAVPVPVTWQLGLAGVAVLSALLMLLMRALSASRWR